MNDAAFKTAAIVRPGKNEHVVRRALEELGVRIVDDEDLCDALVIGTLSPGPMLDAVERLAPIGTRVVAPWVVAQRHRASARAA